MGEAAVGIVGAFLKWSVRFFVFAYALQQVHDADGEAILRTVLLACFALVGAFVTGSRLQDAVLHCKGGGPNRKAD